MSDPIDSNPTTETQTVDTPASEEPSRPVSYESFKRTVLGPPGSPVGPKQVEGEPTRPPAPRAAPREPTLSERLAKLAARERELEQRAKQVEASEEVFLSEEERDQRAIARHEREAVEHVRANPDKYEFTNRLNAHHEVPKLQYAYWTQTGRLLTHEEAAEEVERHFETLYAQASATKKARAGVRSAPAARTPPSWTSDQRPLTDSERIRRAAAVMDEITARRRGR